MQYLNMGVNIYLIMASHNIKIKKSNSIAIPSLCIYKLSQNSNYEIMDFLPMKVLHKIMPLGFNGTFTNIWTTIARPSCINNTSNQFFVQCKMHTHYI